MWGCSCGNHPFYLSSVVMFSVCRRTRDLIDSYFKDCCTFHKQACVTWILVGKQLTLPMDIIYLIGKLILQQDYLNWVGAYKRHDEQMKEKIHRLFSAKCIPKAQMKHVPPISRVEKNARNRQVKQQLKMKQKRFY